jgi:hypothetical protein
MRFMYLVRSASSGPPPQRLMEELGKLAEREMKAGTVVDMGGLMPQAMGVRVRLTGGKVDVIDGPFAEAKEVVGGYAIFDYKSREEALASAVEFMNVHKEYGEGWEGECEMRQVAPPH